MDNCRPPLPPASIPRELNCSGERQAAPGTFERTIWSLFMAGTYCDICNKRIPDGQVFISISVQREWVVPDDGTLQLEIAHIAFQCHPECTPDESTVHPAALV